MGALSEGLTTLGEGIGKARFRKRKDNPLGLDREEFTEDAKRVKRELGLLSAYKGVIPDEQMGIYEKVIRANGTAKDSINAEITRVKAQTDIGEAEKKQLMSIGEVSDAAAERGMTKALTESESALVKKFNITDPRQADNFVSTIQDRLRNLDALSLGTEEGRFGLEQRQRKEERQETRLDRQSRETTRQSERKEDVRFRNQSRDDARANRTSDELVKERQMVMLEEVHELQVEAANQLTAEDLFNAQQTLQETDGSTTGTTKLDIGDIARDIVKLPIGKSQNILGKALTDKRPANRFDTKIQARLERAFSRSDDMNEYVSKVKKMFPGKMSREDVQKVGSLIGETDEKRILKIIGKTRSDLKQRTSPLKVTNKFDKFTDLLK